MDETKNQAELDKRAANKDTVIGSGSGRKDHAPRPITPEDESYGDLMMRFTAHPVKPKYWFEEFGDHWTCSCGQINKGNQCTNCGLERDLLRQLFILHKPNVESPASAAPAGAGTAASVSSTDTDAPASSAEDTVYEDGPARTSHRGLIAGIIIVAVLLLLAAGAFLYFIVLPEMNEQDAATSDAVRSSLVTELPKATSTLPKAQFKAYLAAGDMLADDDDYLEAIKYYKKARKLDSGESVRQKVLAAKYGYVKDHQNTGGETFEKFLDDLVAIGYSGAQTIYDEYYAWHVSIVANNLEDDDSTDMKNVNRRDTIYFHSTLSGGTPGGSVKLYYQIIWPDGTSERKDIDETFHAGSTFTSRFQYVIPFIAKEGKLTFELYNKESHDLLGTDSIQLKK